MAAAMLSVIVARAAAQAWVPEKGEGSVSVLYTNGLVTDHYLTTTKLDIGHIQSHDLLFDVNYGLTERLAVRLSLPLVTSKYQGSFPHSSTYDDGRYHSTFQDFRLDLRYRLSPDSAVVITPFVSAVVPSHNYTYFAHAAAGRRLRELQVGTYVGRTLDPMLPNAFVQMRVGYGFLEEVINTPRSRGYLDLEIGYFLTRRLRVFTAGNGMLTRGGIEMPVGFSRVVPPEVFAHHDQIGRENMLNVGGGATVSVNERIELFAAISTTKAARNTHALNRGVTTGITWRFQRGSNPLDAFAEQREQAVARCVCAKGRSR